MNITFNTTENKKLFEMKGHIPDWHPSNTMKIKIKQSDNKTKKYVLRKNEFLKVQEILPEMQGTMEIYIPGGFIPGDGDNRKLTFILQEISIVEEKTGVNLYEFRNS